MILGETTFRRIANLAILREFNADQPSEVLHMALVRARFCELAAPLCDQDSQEQYLLGMLSLLPAMLRLPMEELTPTLPLRNEIRMALEGAKVPEGVLLAWLSSHEHADWDACGSIACAGRLDEDKLVSCYAEAVVWAESALHFF